MDCLLLYALTAADGAVCARINMDNALALKYIDDLWLACSPKLSDRGLKHAFTTRFNGKHNESMNLALHVGRDSEAAITNRKKVCDALKLPFDRFTTAEQVHGDKVSVVTEKEAGCGRYNYKESIAATDALITTLKDTPLVLFYADCTPVVLADPIRRVAAVVHAGWRGTVAAITQKTAIRMQEEFGCRSVDCLAAIGPSIGPCCYEVDETVHEAAAGLPGYDSLFVAVRPGNWRFDLWRANHEQLLAAGVPGKNIGGGNMCTSCNNETFFSYRAEKGKTGRFAALVWL